MSAGAEVGAVHPSDRKVARESECGGLWCEACRSTAEGDGSHRRLPGRACVRTHARVLLSLHRTQGQTSGFWSGPCHSLAL